MLSVAPPYPLRRILVEHHALASLARTSSQAGSLELLSAPQHDRHDVMPTKRGERLLDAPKREMEVGDEKHQRALRAQVMGRLRQAS
jgi:hypothetical protein